MLCRALVWYLPYIYTQYSGFYNNKMYCDNGADVVDTVRLDWPAGTALSERRAQTRGEWPAVTTTLTAGSSGRSRAFRPRTCSCSCSRLATTRLVCRFCCRTHTPRLEKHYNRNITRCDKHYNRYITLGILTITITKTFTRTALICLFLWSVQIITMLTFPVNIMLPLLS